LGSAYESCSSYDIWENNNIKIRGTYLGTSVRHKTTELKFLVKTGSTFFALGQEDELQVHRLFTWSLLKMYAKASTSCGFILRVHYTRAGNACIISVSYGILINSDLSCNRLHRLFSYRRIKKKNYDRKAYNFYVILSIQTDRNLNDNIWISKKEKNLIFFIVIDVFREYK
jgi:hypothetical protein